MSDDAYSRTRGTSRPADEWAPAGGLAHDDDLDPTGGDPEAGYDEELADDDLLEEDLTAREDEELADDVLEDDGHDDEDTGAPDARRRGRRRSPLVRGLTYLLALAVVVSAAVVGWRVLSPLIPDIDLGASQVADYEGEGSGEVAIDVPPGAGGAEIGAILQDADVVASGATFADLTAAEPAAQSIQPGTYLMSNQMSASAALDRMLDPEALQAERVTLPEGLWVSETFARLAEATGNEVADYEAVDPAELDLPDAAGGELEGFLYPQTYSFATDSTPAEQLQQMVDQGVAVRADLGFGDNERSLVTIASLVQSEGRLEDDLAPISRVIRNRLAEDQPLQFDSTIHYIEQARGRASTSDEARAIDNPYNTYLNPGLPPGPIANPGRPALEAAAEPAEGDWLYFVTVDPSTGETLFAETFEEHEENVAVFQQWCRDNPDQC